MIAIVELDRADPAIAAESQSPEVSSYQWWKAWALRPGLLVQDFQVDSRGSYASNSTVASFHSFSMID